MKKEKYITEQHLRIPTGDSNSDNFTIQDPGDEDLLYSLGKTVGYAEQYVNKRLEHTKLEITEILAVTLSSLTSGVVIGLTGMLALVFLSVGLGFWISMKIDSLAGGFAIVGGIYIFIAILTYFIMHKYLLNFILDAIIKIIFNKK